MKKNIFIGMLILMTMVATSNAAVIRSNIIATASDEYVTIMDPFTLVEVDGRAVNVLNTWKFNEKTGRVHAGRVDGGDSPSCRKDTSRCLAAHGRKHQIRIHP